MSRGGGQRMKLRRRTFLQFAGAATASVFARVAKAQVYPARPITMVVPFAAGGPADIPGRVIAERMRKSLGQPVVIENIGGAAGSIGAGRVARATPDGYTIVLGNMSTHVMNAAFYSLAYDVADGSGCSFCQENHAGGKFAGVDRLAQSQSRQGVGGLRQRHVPSHQPVLFEGERDADRAHSLSWQRPRNAGPGRRPDRPVFHDAGRTAFGARREREGLCGD